MCYKINLSPVYCKPVLACCSVNCKFQLLKLLKQTVDDYARDGRPGEV